MKLKVDLSNLWIAAKQMGPLIDIEDFNLEPSVNNVFQLDIDLSATTGIEIILDDLQTDKGVLSYQGRQIFLFIPDQGNNIDDALNDPMKGRRYHVAECKTLEQMRNRNRFGRYQATNNLEGKFHIYGVSRLTGTSLEGEANLKVCMNCLKYLNYQGFETNPANKKNIHLNFDIASFLSHYSTLFTSMPPPSHFEKKGGYSDDWQQISASYRQSLNYTCEACKVNLNQYKHLLHTHHISGNKRENNTNNLQALCVDCHRKQPKHDYMRVEHSDMLKINSLRYEQGLFISRSWKEALKMADTSIRGLLLSYQAQGDTAPIIAHTITNANGKIISQLDAAWPERKFGIVINESDYKAAVKTGWNVKSVGDALNAFN